MIDARNEVSNPGGAATIAKSQRIGIAVHHSVSGQKLTVTSSEQHERDHIRTIDRYHVDQGYGGFGYHAAVFPSGRAYLCGNLESMRAHVAKRNHQLLGVVLIGDFTSQLPGQEQLTGLAGVLDEFRTYLGRDVPVQGHTEWALPGEGTGCPGRLVELDFDNLRPAGAEGIYDMKWVCWADRPDSTQFRSYLVWAAPDGLRSRFVPNYAEHQALAESGVAGALTPVSIETLRQFHCSPDPAS